MLKKLAICVAALCSGPAFAEIYTDYAPSKEVWNVTLVNVKPNKMDAYLMGVRQTWVSSCEERKKLGTLVDCSVMVSTNPNNGGFNVMLIQKAPNAAVSDPDAAIQKKLDDALKARLAQDKRDAIVSSYESMRTMVGQQDFRKILFK
ncbi:hypothetical protein D5I55_10365 [Chakrabartia godavariana]|nr:hypothetical protein D5I55_10365 [Chakrabartia godavariana]